MLSASGVASSPAQSPLVDLQESSNVAEQMVKQLGITLPFKSNEELLHQLTEALGQNQKFLDRQE